MIKRCYRHTKDKRQADFCSFASIACTEINCLSSLGTSFDFCTQISGGTKQKNQRVCLWYADSSA